MTEVIVTNHAAKRFKQRVGLPKKACQKHAQTAYDKGYKHSEAKGNAKKYLDGLYLRHSNANAMRIYGSFVYIFCGNCLITVFGLPKNLKNGFNKSL